MGGFTVEAVDAMKTRIELLEKHVADIYEILDANSMTTFGIGAGPCEEVEEEATQEEGGDEWVLMSKDVFNRGHISFMNYFDSDTINLDNALRFNREEASYIAPKYPDYVPVMLVTVKDYAKTVVHMSSFSSIFTQAKVQAPTRPSFSATA